MMRREAQLFLCKKKMIKLTSIHGAQGPPLMHEVGHPTQDQLEHQC